MSSSIASHSWNIQGIFQVKVKAKDVYNAESEWSDTLTVNITNITYEEPEEPKTGWIFGIVSNTSGQPLEGASVCVNLTEVTQDCELTDEEGLYQLLVPTGSYTVEASKEGYELETETVVVEENQAMNINFQLEKSGEDVEPVADEKIQQLNQAIEDGFIGGQLRFKKEGQQISYEEIRYDEISFTLIKVDLSQYQISFIVDGEIPEGKTIVVKLESSVFPTDNLFDIKYDGVSIKEAEGGFLDILDPTDDGALPQYYMFIEESTESMFFLISIPRFSEHTITITSIVQAIGGIIAVLLYITIGLIALSIFVGPIITGVIQRKMRLRRIKR